MTYAEWCEIATKGTSSDMVWDIIRDLGTMETLANNRAEEVMRLQLQCGRAEKELADSRHELDARKAILWVRRR